MSLAARLPLIPARNTRLAGRVSGAHQRALRRACVTAGAALQAVLARAADLPQLAAAGIFYLHTRHSCNHNQGCGWVATVLYLYRRRPPRLWQPHSPVYGAASPYQRGHAASVGCGSGKGRPCCGKGTSSSSLEGSSAPMAVVTKCRARHDATQALSRSIIIAPAGAGISGHRRRALTGALWRATGIPGVYLQLERIREDLELEEKSL